MTNEVATNIELINLIQYGMKVVGGVVGAYLIHQFVTYFTE